MPNEEQNLDLPKNHFSGSYIPRSVCGHFQLLFDIVRLIICAVMLVCDCSNDYEYIIYDGSCLIIPILRLKCNKILYYCSDPKKMARPVKTNILKKCFRLAINLLRELTAGMASTIIVNSTYAQRIFQDNFPLVSVSNNRKRKDLISFREYIIMKRHYPRILYTPIT